MKQLYQTMLDLMTLKCPTCSNPVDPFPDACSAIMCLYCGNHYCNYCFEAFASGQSDVDRASAHMHAATHNDSKAPESRDAFLSNALIRDGQRQYLDKILKRCVSLALSSQDIAHQEVALVLVLVSTELSDLELRAMDIWTSSRQRVLHDAAVRAQKEAIRNSEVSASPKNLPPPPHLGPGKLATAENSESDVMDMMDSEVGTYGGADVRGSPSAHRSGAKSSPSNKQSPNRKRGSSGSNSFSGGGVAKKQGGDGEFGGIYQKPQTSSEKAAASSASPSSLSIPATSTLVPAQKQGGRQIANAILTDNGYAISQILQTFRGPILDVDYIETKHGHPLATLAILAGQSHVAVELIKCGADPLVRNSGGRNVMYIATESGAMDVVLAILQMHPEFDLNSAATTETQRYFPIHVAARYNHRHLIKLFHERGGLLDPEEGEHGYTPLTLALVLGHQWAASELIKLGCSLRVRSMNGRTPMFVAAEKGLSEIMQLVFETREFDINEPVVRPSGLRLMHVAAFHHKSFILGQLIQLGANVNVLDDEGGYTPLAMAIIGNSTTCAIELIEAGASVTHTSMSGRTPLYVAVEKGMTEVVVKLISERGVSVNEPTALDTSGSRPLHLALLHGQTHLVSVLLKLGADVAITDSEKKCTPLLMACILEDEWSVKKFLSVGSSVSDCTTEGRTALYIAAEKGSPTLIRLLLEAGKIDINQPCTSEAHRGTPLHIAAMFNNSHAAMVLLEKGADPTLRDARNRRPIDLARESNSSNVVSILEELTEVPTRRRGSGL